MATLKPTSMLLGTTRPAELRARYIKALAPESTGEGAIDLGGFLLVIDGRDDVDAKNSQPGRVIINFDVDDFDAVAAQLNAADVEWIAIEGREKGKFGTFADPTGTACRSSSGARTPATRRPPARWPNRGHPRSRRTRRFVKPSVETTAHNSTGRKSTHEL